MIATRVVSRTPPERWEDALISGNGSTGIMMLGRPLDDLIIVNHEKLWVVGTDCAPEAPDLREAWKEARRIVADRRYRDADRHVVKEARRILGEMFGDASLHRGARLPYDRTHPAFHLHVATEPGGAVEGYRREMDLETGELSVCWSDGRGEWRRRAFVSRTDDVIVLEMLPPEGTRMDASLGLTEAPGSLPGDLGEVTVVHEDNELYLHAAYGRTLGRDEPEGYHALGRVHVRGGTGRAIDNGRLDIRDAEGLLLVMRLEYLDRAGQADREALGRKLAELPAEYEALMSPHAAVHGEMFRRVTLDLGSDPEAAPASEDVIERSAHEGPTPEFLELLHAAGRYALVCGGTGELAPSLMGIWGNEWNPAWDGRYTFDANLNLAVSAGSQGDLPEVMETYFRFVERSARDWPGNAARLYGCRGLLTDLCQGWRHGVVLMATYPWTGGAGWLASYFYDHYLYTRDRSFLRERVVPLLREVARFYEDFLEGTDDESGRAVFYPSVSPENSPVMEPAEQSTNVVPNATCEIAICREVLTNLVSACRELGIEKESIPRWEALLARLPGYVVNTDGALAEWAFAGLGDHYDHRHSSHLYPLYPSLEISPERTPALFDAARRAVEKRLEAGLGNKSAHGIMHASFVAAQLKDPELALRMLTEFARLRFVNSSFITCHNPGPSIYNLDTTFSMPGLLMKLLVHSEPGLLEFLPAWPGDRFPRGTARGILARGGVTVEELCWDLAKQRLSVRLRSSRAQSVRLLCRAALRPEGPVSEGAAAQPRRVGPLDEPETTRLARAAGEWRLDLPAGTPVTLVW
ncbi:MAG: glycosyl hydrolase family 95 catalytic domain-containing protein [Planctomycetota bacterium]|jgi:hypothetical protein